jgi:hypothetical protein
MVAADLTLPIATVTLNVADLVSAIAWPAVIIAVIFVLRNPLQRLASRIGASAQSLSIGPSGFSVEFGAAVRDVPTQSSTVLGDLRTATPQLADSGSDTMFAQLASEAPAPHLLVDLGEGREWLTTRLYLFALMLASMRRTRTLVFVETVMGVRGRLVGLAAVGQVHAALARVYPWLEADYAHAYADATMTWRTGLPPAGGPASFVLDHYGRLEQGVAQALVRDFLRNVKSNAPAAPTGGPEWVNELVDDIPLIEHARWLTGVDIERILGPALERFAYLIETAPRTPAEIAAATLRMQGHDVIALVDEQHRFRGVVVDRRPALDALAQEALPDSETQARQPAR